MEIHTRTYRTFAEVEMLHDYYRFDSPDYDIHKDLECIPSADCQQVLRDHRILFRKVRTGFRLLIEATAVGGTPDFSPAIPVEAPLKLTFMLRLRNPYFINFTNLLLVDAPAHLYYFTNLNDNLGHLSQVLPGYTPEADYHFGDLIFQGGRVYEANTSIPGAPAGFVPTPDWTELADNIPYVSVLDRLRKQGNLFRYATENPNPGEQIEFTLSNQFGTAIPLGNIPNTTQPMSPIQAPVGPGEDINYQIGLGKIPMGRYKLDVAHQLSSNPDPFDFYLFDPIKYANIFGVIELFVHTEVPNDYRLVHTELIDATDTLVLDSPVFRIHFRNRSTTWRYLGQDGAETVNAGIRPLTKSYSGFTDAGNLLPDPGVQKLAVNSDATGLIESINSEIYL